MPRRVIERDAIGRVKSQSSRALRDQQLLAEQAFIVADDIAPHGRGRSGWFFKDTSGWWVGVPEICQTGCSTVLPTILVYFFQFSQRD